MTCKIPGIAAFALLALVTPSMGQGAGDAQRGLAIAQTSCAQCHAIARGEILSPRKDAPAFAKLAAIPGMTRTALNVALHTAHKNMPNLIVKSDEIDDLAAYLATLE